MGTFKIPTVGRKTRDVAPKLTSKAPESLADPFTRDVPQLARAIGDTGRALGDLAGDIVERVGKHREKKRNERVGNEYLDTYTRGEQLYQEFREKEEFDDDDPVTSFNADMEKIISEAEVRLGGDQASIADLRKRLLHDRKFWSKGLATKVVVDREVAAATYESNLLDKNARALMADPTPDRLDASMQQMASTIREQGGHTEGKETQLINLANQRLVEAYLGSIGPERALVELDSRKLGYGAMFTDTKSKESFRRVLETKARNQKVRAENERQQAADKIEADTLNALLNNEEVDPFEVYNHPAIKDDKDALKATKSMFDNNGKDIDVSTRKTQYSDMLNQINKSTDLRKLRNSEIINSVKDGTDSKRLISLKDAILDETLNSTWYKEVTVSLENDYNTGKLGGKVTKKGIEDDTGEADQLYFEIRTTLENWALANRDKNPREFYQELMAPLNAEYFDNQWFSETRLFPEDISIAREKIAAGIDRSAWIRRAQKLNPDYTEDEIGAEYDRQFGGAQ